MNNQTVLQAIRMITSNYFRKVRIGVVAVIIALIPGIIKAVMMYNDPAYTTERVFDQIMGLVAIASLAMCLWVVYSIIEIQNIHKITQKWK